jgi:3',5'-cyclic AMP phosphodiesterase CpdA
MRIIQISDTHLSRDKPHFADNWPPLAAWIAAQNPDLVIHTGDVTIDGADVEDDLRYAAELMRSLGVRFRAVPGNITTSATPDTPGSRSRTRVWLAGGPISAWTGGSRMSRVSAWSALTPCCSATGTPKRRPKQPGSMQ